MLDANIQFEKFSNQKFKNIPFIWLFAYPAGIRRLLNWLVAEYGDWDIYITENGVADNQKYYDYDRVQYMKTYLNEVLKAIELDGINVKGYCIWSLMDNFEWSDGFKDRFGVHYIDFDAPDNSDGTHNRDRIPKLSLNTWNDIIENGFSEESNSLDLLYHGDFPFQFGFGSTAFQSEGAYETRENTIWDEYFDSKLLGPENWRDIYPADSLNTIEDDIQRLKRLGAKHYDISISWARVLKSGMAVYEELIDKILSAGIEPHVTLYYWDLPLSRGTWDERSLTGKPEIVKDFGSFVEKVVNAIGDKVNVWQTISRPQKQAIEGYDIGISAPSPRRADLYRVLDNQLQAHADAYDFIKKNNKNSKVGIILDGHWYEPFDETDHDILAATERIREFHLGWVLEPFISGEYPTVMNKTTVPDAPRRIKGKLDFISLDYNQVSYVFGTLDQYNDGFVGSKSKTELPPWDINRTKLKKGSSQFEKDHNVWTGFDWRWSASGNVDERFYPDGFMHCVQYLQNKLSNTNIALDKIMLSFVDNPRDRSMTIGDKDRQRFYATYINRLLNPDVLPISYVTIYSVTDSIEWQYGNSQSRGLFKASGEMKDSALFMSEMARDRGMYGKDHVCEYDPARDDLITGTFPDNMLWGSATSAYQVEGAWNADGKGPHIWDDWAHYKDDDGNCHVNNCDNGDVACDSYNKIEEDIEAMKSIGSNFYRFSISWARVIPTERDDQKLFFYIIIVSVCFLFSF